MALFAGDDAAQPARQDSTVALQHWRPIPAAMVEQWNQRLLLTSASVYQYPYWNEPYRRMGCTPKYIVYGPDETPLTFACVLTLSLAGIRIGLLLRGPARLQEEGGPSEPQGWRSLAGWARSAGYAFLRITHPDSGFLDTMVSAGAAKPVDAFPLHRDPRSEAIVPLRDDEETLLATFSKSVSREIERAEDAGWEVRATDDESAFAAVWPTFEAHAQRKGFSYGRPLTVWLDTIRRARGSQCARIYTAHRNGRTGGAALIYRDGTTAHGISAYDLEAVKSRSSPACLLHWTAMLECRRLGCRQYSLGTTGVAHHFKEKFHPLKLIYASPVTMVANQLAYRLWPLRAVRFLQPLWPRIKSAMGRRAQ
jgi:hypothetical protein